MVNSISYLNCPRCGLSVRARPEEVSGASGPRGRGRAGLQVPMYETDRLRPPVTAPDGDVPAPRRTRPEGEPQAA